MHNGLIRDVMSVKHELAFAVDSSLYPMIEGSTDSELFFYLALTYGLQDELIGNLIPLGVYWETTGKSWPWAAMAAQGHDFRRVLALVTRGEVAGGPLWLELSKIRQQMTPRTVIGADRFTSRRGKPVTNGAISPATSNPSVPTL
jgi:hypothetical protein